MNSAYTISFPVYLHLVADGVLTPAISLAMCCFQTLQAEQAMVWPLSWVSGLNEACRLAVS